MRHFFSLIVLLAIVCDNQALAENPALKPEIDHLLTYISSSNCVYIRNNTEHSSTDAVKHISRKYKHFFDEIKSAEDFIELSASRSSLTGKDYWVRCGSGDSMKARSWLITELHAFRSVQ
jgi:hypothetical protein